MKRMLERCRGRSFTIKSCTVGESCPVLSDINYSLDTYNTGRTRRLDGERF